MARWILNRPREFSNSAELQVAEWLAELNDDWLIRWGFSYTDDRGTAREGDFLVLGPQGGLLVMEVKGGRLNHLAATGHWNTEDGDHPVAQLMAEWNAVIRAVGPPVEGVPPLFVGKVLALPHVFLGEQEKSYFGIERNLIFTGKELQNFERSWSRYFASFNARFDGRQREQFFRSFGAEATAESIRHFVSQTDRILIRQTESNYELLDLLAENRQFLVRGGTGTGKTWLAFELACRWAEESGGRVLFLCYNLAFAHLMAELAKVAKERGKLRRGEVVVRSWEQLAGEVLEVAGGYEEPPEDFEKRTVFFEKTVPELMRMVVQEGGLEEQYAALVVDEAQDHDTGFAETPAGWDGPGWWGVYWALVKDGREGKVGLFYDAAQRPVFRNELFDPKALEAALPGAVRIQLQTALRYTKPVFHFLKELKCEATLPLLAGFGGNAVLPNGPEVRVIEAGPERFLEELGRLVSDWIENGYCKAEEILILSRYSAADRSVLGETERIGRWNIVDYLDRRYGCVSRTSVNKAKGLDSLAVILVDFPHFGEMSRPEMQAAFFMGASRARQLLAQIVVLEEEEGPAVLSG